MRTIKVDSAQVKIPPPIYLLGAIIVGFVVHWFYPIELVSPALRWAIGLPVIILGLSIIIYCATLFKKAQTDIKPWEPTSQIISSGIYRFSRNPIYFSFIIVGIGTAITINTLWVLIMMIPLVLLLNRNVIFKEESYLEKKFGQEYLNYKNRVRRWI